MATISKATIRKNGKFTRYIAIFWFFTVFLFLTALANVFFFESGGIGVSRSAREEEKSAADGDVTTTTTTGDGGGSTQTLTVNKSKATSLREGSSRSSPSSSAADSANTKDKTDDDEDDDDTTNNSNNDGISPFQRGDAMLYHHTLSGNHGKEAAVVLDMLMVHAHAFNDGETYGGSCGEGNDVGRDPENSLIDAIGLGSELRFECPRDNEYDGRKKMLAYRHYTEDGTRGMTPEYVSLLKSVVDYPSRSEVFSNVDDPDRFTIVVHIKRGSKITPCRKPFKDFDPYLPNLHFQNLIDKYMKPNARVVIFSQSDSYESFDSFKDKGYELHLDEEITDAWRHIVMADVAILSRSSFSFVPAVVSKGTVVYTPFWYKPIRGWDTVGKDVLATTADELKRLQASCPVKKDKLSRFRAQHSQQ
jgi:hypothetical protein